MPEYRRNRLLGGCYFFTVNLLDRDSDTLVMHIDLLRNAVRKVRRRRGQVLKYDIPDCQMDQSERQRKMGDRPRFMGVNPWSAPYFLWNGRRRFAFALYVNSPPSLTPGRT